MPRKKPLSPGAALVGLRWKHATKAERLAEGKRLAEARRRRRAERAREGRKSK